MRQISTATASPSDSLVKNIRVVLDGSRDELGIAGLCRRGYPILPGDQTVGPGTGAIDDGAGAGDKR